MDSIRLREASKARPAQAPKPDIEAALREAGLWLDGNEYAEVTIQRKGNGLFLEKRSTKVFGERHADAKDGCV